MRLLEEVLPPPPLVTAAAASSAPAPGNSGTGAATVRSTASSKLDAELKQLRERQVRFITCGQEVAKGTGFVKFAGDAVASIPSEAVVRVLEAQKAEFQATSSAPSSSRLLCRVLPIDHTCKPHIEDFQKLAEAVILPHLDLDAEPTVWALEFRARNTTTLKKEAVLSVIDSFWSKERHKVNLNDPEKCILVEVNPLFCGISILPRWAELRKYNLHALTSSEESEPQPKKATKAVASSAASSAPEAGDKAAERPTGSPTGSSAAESPADEVTVKDSTRAPTGEAPADVPKVADATADAVSESA